ncbi:THAP domain-containing protein [Ooceraea biroi]|uniref:THAP domain-containing protein n=1 Tax=Ooceraea biroi TaxID=2015173 RepID=A0A026WJR4_OOCBI|nr:THAP domain-containing protein [Ooceraea biroi]
MNVRLAAQTLSQSVADALIFCENIDASFIGAMTTAEFCSYFNKAFNILNSHNKFSKQPYNQPISANTLDIYSAFIENFCHYVNSLRNMNGRKLIHCVRHRGFLGFITALRNSIELYKHLNNTYNLKYLLTYKLCQDHIENLFSFIRSCDGFNNNPSCTQFDCI